MKPIYAHAAGALALSFAIAACVPKPRPAPPVQPRPTPVAKPAPLPPPPPSNWLDAPQTPGDWSYRSETGGGRAEFRAEGAVLFTMRCDRSASSMVLTRANAAGSPRMTIRTETQSRDLAAMQDNRDLYAASARIGAGDRLLDAMALSKGRFAVETGNTAALYLPAWAEVTRVIEDCR